MKCLVTGSAGFIGQHLVRRLKADGHVVKSFDLLNDEDLTIIPCLEDFLVNKDVVFHLAAATGLHRTFEEYLQNNIVATQRLLEACNKVKLKKFVLASTSSVYGRENGDGTEEADTCPISWYGCTKLAAEDLCCMYQSQHGLPLAVLRFFSVYGPNQRVDMGIRKFIDAALKGNPLSVCGDGKQLRSYTYIDDVINAVICSISLPVGTYNVSGSDNYNVWDLVQMLNRVSGEYELNTISIPSRQGEQQSAVGNCSKLNKSGWRAKVDLEAGLRRQWEWQKNL